MDTWGNRGKNGDLAMLSASLFLTQMPETAELLSGPWSMAVDAGTPIVRGCSGPVETDLVGDTISAASIEYGREGRIDMPS